MTTDQIQTKLFEKADASTKEAVNETLTPVANWISRNGSSTHKVTLALSSGALVAQDGVPIKVDDEDLRRKLGYGTVKFTLGTVLEELRKTMFNTLQGPERVRFVDEFITDVQRLKDDIEDLQSRVK
jgi:hypothetical protein